MSDADAAGLSQTVPSKLARLGEKEPRERVGAQTGRKYAYQYERTARATLDLLDGHSKHVCVYCEWHDDYVMESGDPPTKYTFHQVKGRKSSQGPWSLRELTGVTKGKRSQGKKPSAVQSDAVLPLMIQHYANFSTNCAGLAFVTNAGLDTDSAAFLSAIARASSVDSLDKDDRAYFERVLRAYKAATPPLASSSDELFAWLRGWKIYQDQGKLEDGEAALLELANVVTEYSEIELLLTHSKQIARELVTHVRSKADHLTTVVPSSDEDLRRNKGITISEVLTVLSLSVQGYEALKSGTQPDTVKTLSRLHRYCQTHGLEAHITQLCRFKAEWDVWRTVERHTLNGADYVTLESRARDVLRAGLTLNRIVAESKAIASQFANIAPTALTAEHVLGLIVSLAAESERR